jgi:hypothetical protein
MSENGQGKLTGWIIAIVGGRAFIGRQRGEELSPVYDLQSGIQFGPQGQVARPCMAVPVLGLGSIRKLPMPPGTIVIPCVDLSREDQRALLGAIAMGEEIQSKMTAVDTGIIVAPAGTKLPPMKGDRS